MSNRKHYHQLVIEHEYEDSDEELPPALTPSSLKEESPLSEEPIVKETRPRKAPRLDGYPTQGQHIHSTLTDPIGDSPGEVSGRKGRRGVRHGQPTSLTTKAAQTSGGGSAKRGRKPGPVSVCRSPVDKSSLTALTHQATSDHDLEPPAEITTLTSVKDECEKGTSSRKRKSNHNSTSNTIFLVGLDFGMTRSGIWWAAMRSGHVRASQVFDQWLGSQQNAIKIPTAIAYPQNNEHLKQIRTGNEIDADLRVCAWFKELLNFDQPLEEYDDSLLRSAVGEELSRLPEGVTREMAVKDFIHAMNDRFLSVLGNNFGQKLIEQSEIRYMLTHPAKWSEHAKILLRDAAREAGLQDLKQREMSFMTEPEAAMIAVTKEHQEIHGKEDIPFKKDNSVMVIDIGGSTVDTAVFYVKQVKPHLLVTQACPPNSARCGFTTIDRNLHEVCGFWFGDAFTNLTPLRKGPRSAFMRDFESSRTAFDNEDEARIYRLTLRIDDLHHPGLKYEQYDLEHGHILLRCDDMRDLFQPAIDKTCALIENTLQSIENPMWRPKTFVLAGGGASCEYMRQSIETRFHSYREIREIQFLTPKNPLIAVAKGAALSADSRYIVMERLCVRSYGTVSRQRFNTELDAENDAVFNAAGTKMVDKGCDWIIKKGTPYTLKNPCQETRQLSVWLPEKTKVDSQRFEWPLIVHDGDGEPPKRFSEDDATVRKVATIKLDLTKAEESGEIIEDDELDYEKIAFQMVMKMDFRTNAIEVEAKQGRRKIIGTQTIMSEERLE